MCYLDNLSLESHSPIHHLPPFADLLLFLRIPHPPKSPLFPYTTLFRSASASGPAPTTTRSGRMKSAIAEPSLRNSGDRKSTRLNSSHRCISYAVFCLKKKKKRKTDYNKTVCWQK